MFFLVKELKYNLKIGYKTLVLILFLTISKFFTEIIILFLNQIHCFKIFL